MLEEWIMKLILRKLRRHKKVRIVDLFGGVVSNSRRSKYRYSKYEPILHMSPEMYAFQLAKRLEAKGLVKVEYIDGRNWIVRLWEPIANAYYLARYLFRDVP